MVNVETSTIELQDEADVLTIKLNRPEKLNAITDEMMNGLHDLWQELSENPEKAVVLTGAGDATCAGADTDVIEADDFSTSESEYEHKQQEIFQMMQTYPRPTVLAGKGAVVGAAFIFALECDFTVLGDETTFQYPETQMGMFSDRTPKLLSHLHGAQLAREVVLKGDAIAPERAAETGLATEVVPEGEVDATARELAGKLAEFDPKVTELITETLQFDYDPDAHVGYP
jgi:enoyl-CoA hydratase/carnithine racemase